MNQFLKYIHDLNIIPEQGPPPPPGEQQSPDTGETDQEPVTEPEQTTEPLSPESEVLLVRLLKKALVINMDPNDVMMIDNMSEVNEVNAKQTLKELVQIMNSYSTTIDIDVD